MNWAQIISTLIFVIGTFAAVLEGIVLARMIAQRLPEHTRLALEQFARMAVQKVEQQYAKESGPNKKALAIQAIKALFEAFHLPPPPAIAIDIAIEAAVLLLPKSAVVESNNPPKIEAP